MLQQEELVNVYGYLSDTSHHQSDSITINRNPIFLFTKRTFDILMSTIGLTLLSPLFLVIAIFIKSEDPKGNVFYMQLRTGINGTALHEDKLTTIYSGIIAA